MSLITYLTRIHFADRVLEDALAEEMRRHGIRRPLILSDATGGAGEAPDRLADALPAACRAAETAEEADGLLGFGGTEALDAARQAGASGRLPVIAVPTTAESLGLGPLASGAEAPLPAAILCDPTLTVACGPDRTAAAGMDVLAHCIEAWLGTAFNPPADGIALEGLRRGAPWLVQAVRQGDDLEARRELMAAALCAGLAAPKGFGGTEALARAVEAEAGAATPHGWYHAALLPQVLRFNAPAVAPRFAPLAAALGLSRAADLATALGDLGAAAGLPRRLGPQLGPGFGADAVARAAAAAAENPAARTNPRHATPADWRALIEAAL